MRCIFALVSLILISSSLAFAEETAPVQGAEKIAIKTSVSPKEVRTYKAEVQIGGFMPMKYSPEPVKLDTKYTLKVQHKYGTWDKDGLMTLEISLLGGQMNVGDDHMALDSSFFNKLTLLIDRDWRIKSIFGTTGTDYEHSKPGLNWVNMILLFYLYGADTPHALGESWDAKVRLPLYQENYNFTNTIKALEDVDSSKTALVGQEIAWTPKSETDVPNSTCKATTKSNFALDNGKLIRSRADCDVEFVPSPDTTKEQDVKALHANIRIDITAAD